MRVCDGREDVSDVAVAARADVSFALTGVYALSGEMKQIEVGVHVGEEEQATKAERRPRLG